MATERSLYEVLGVGRDASTRAMRDAYRARARQLHPDVAGSTDVASGVSMAEVNRAWSVLSNPRRRAEYDRSLEDGSDAPGRDPGAGSRATRDARRASPLLPQARVPWRGLLTLAAVGIALVLIADAASSPSTPPPPDQLLEPGSCVAIDERSEAHEVSCAGPHDAVVRQLVAFDRPCPTGSSAHRDRQGMGTACVDRVPATSTTSRGGLPVGTGVPDQGGSG